MKILQVIPFFSPKFGGTVNAMYNISKELSNRGHDVTIITTDIEFDKDYSATITRKGIKLIKFKCIFNFASFLYSPSMNVWLDANINEYDIIHLHNFRSYQNAMVHKYARRYNIPYILQAHGSLPLIIAKTGFKRIFDFVWGNKLLKDASRLIAVSNVEFEQYIEFGVSNEKIDVIPNIIEIEKFQKKLIKGKFKKEHEIKTSKIILFLGRIHQIKGLKFLIKAFERILQEINDVSLVIAGPDEGYGDELKKFVESLGIKDNVYFIDYINNVQNAYFDADVLVYPAEYEIFGLVPFEAIVCGTPVIVSDDCGCSEIMKNADSGYTVKYGDIKNLSKKISILLLNPGMGRNKIQNGLNYIKSNLNPEIVSKKVESVYLNVLKI